MASNPHKIMKLDETVVNRIAAGEVIQHPANAIKELLENSLDAKATQISVNVKQGGLKLIQIQDNGTGINKEDLTIACERFTTSKLQEFKDLSKITSYGFRGEALASISHVAHITILTRTKYEKCGWRVAYCDGKPKGAAKPCAGNVGTIITAEDLFYNIVTRRKSMKSPSEEYSKILEVVSRYAIHNAEIGFTLKKVGEPSTDFRTPPNSSVKNNIQIVFGPSLAKELLEISGSDELLKFSLKGFISNANYSAKKCIFLLFINNRLVHSVALKKSIENVYISYLPKGMHSFVYLSIEISPENVDVNVHPTKHEVHFLHEEKIAEKLQQLVDSTLLGSNSSRTFYKQTLLPGMGCHKADSVLQPENDDCKNTSETNKEAERIYAHQMVRTDSKSQKLDKFLTSTQKSVPNFNSSHRPQEKLSEQSSSQIISGRREILLTSIINLKKEFETVVHHELKSVIFNHTFVGCVTPELALIQYSTQLYLCKTILLSEELFYQILIRDFGNFGTLNLSEPASIYDLIIMALELEESGWSEEDGSKHSLAMAASDLIKSHGSMLDDYFSFQINDEGYIETLPYVLDNYVPWLEKLPMYLLRLSTEVNWDEEEQCFSTLCRETAKFLSIPATISEEDEDLNEQNENNKNWRWKIEHLLYPAMKKCFLPPQQFANDSVFLKIADLPDLYKVFERC